MWYICGIYAYSHLTGKKYIRYARHSFKNVRFSQQFFRGAWGSVVVKALSY